MKLTLRLIFAVIALIILILGADAYFSVRRESEFLERELEGKAYRIGKSMQELVADAWRREGPEVTMKFIQSANQADEMVSIRLVLLDARDDRFRPIAPAERLDDVAHTEALTIRYRGPDGRAMLLTYVTVNIGNRPGALELSQPLTVVNEFVRQSMYRKVGVAASVVLGTLGVTLLLGIWLVGWPLNRLTEKARRVGSGDLTEPLLLPGHDELSELAKTLNQMCERLEETQQKVHQETEARIATIEQLRHADRLRTVGQLASGVAHELGTPLNVVTGRASLISSGRLGPEAISESAEIIKTQAERMAGIIRKLLDFSRTGSSRRVTTDLRSVIREAVQILEPLGRKHSVSVINTEQESQRSEPMLGCVDPGQIQQVLTNLIVNAIQATPAGGQVTVRIDREQHAGNPVALSPAGDYFCLTVDDTGQGIAPELKERLFEPFVTTKDVGQGTGLGLSIAYGIVREHGGWIDVDSEIGRGSRFRVYLPARSEPCPAES